MEIYKHNFLKEDKNGVIIFVRIIPNSSQNSVTGYSDDYVKLRIKAPAIENKANKELILFLSEILKVSKSNIQLLSGGKSKLKKILLKNSTLSEISQKIYVYDKIIS